jgi:PAS domain S-box-containing protein
MQQNYHSLLHTIEKLQEQIVLDLPSDEILKNVLHDCLYLTNAEFGLLIEIDSKNASKPILRGVCGCSSEWDEEAFSFFVSKKEKTNYRIDSLIGNVFFSKQATISNSVIFEKEKDNLPSSFPKFENCISIPLTIGKTPNIDVLGIVALFNHPQGFEAGFVSFLQPLLKCICPIISNKERANTQNQLVKNNTLKEDIKNYEAELEAQNEELRNSQTLLFKFRNEYEALFNHAPIGYVVLDSEGLIVKSNRLVLEWLYEKGHKKITKVPFSMFLVVEERKKFSSFIQEIHQNPHNDTILLKLDVEKTGYKWVKIKAVLFQSEEQFKKQVLITLTDVSKERETEIALLDSKMDLQILLDTMPALIWEADSTMKCFYFNKAWLNFRGKSLSEEIGNQWFDGIHPNDLKLSIQKHKYAYVRKEPFTIEYRLQRFDGEYRWILNKAIPKFNSNQEFVGYIGAGIDIHEQKIAEKQVNEAKQMLGEILDTLGEGVIKIDKQGKVVFANKATYQILESVETTIEGRDYKSFYPSLRFIDIHGSIFKNDENPIIQSIEQRKSIHNNQIGVILGDKVKWLSVNTAPFFEKDNKVAGAVASFEDISPLIKTQNELNRKNLELASFKNALNQNFIISYSNIEGTIIEVNENMLKVSGYTENELLGANFRIFNSKYHSSDFFADLWKTIKSGNSWRGELRNKNKEGKVFWLDVIIIPFKDDKGLVNKFLQIGYDISKRKETENTVHQLSLVAKHTDDSVIITDKDDKILWVNEGFEKMTGYNFNEVIGKIPGSFLQGKNTDPETVAKLKQAVLNHENIQVEIINYHKNGSPYWLSLDIMPLYDEKQNEFIGFFSIQRNITQRKEAEANIKKQNEELKTANYELDSFVYHVSHDLRSPVASSLGVLEICQIINDLPTILQYLALQKTSLQKMDNFIRDILDYSRNARMRIERVNFSIKELIEEIIHQNSNQKGKDKIKFYINTPKDDIIFGDKFRIRVILHNLMTNAIKFVRPYEKNPYVKINVQKSEIGIEMSVEDNGIGIREEHLNNIFEMFYRATDTNHGSGLGLYIVKEMLHKMGGYIKVKSMFEIGTTFFLFIPSQEISNL